MRSILAAAAVLLLSTIPSFADEVPDQGGRDAIQRTIRQQLDAFRSGDATTAESFASSGIRDKFPDPTSFMAMVKQAYGPLVAPRSSRFGELSQTPLGLVQKLELVDGAGQAWTAAYVMTLVDGAWRISGCYMLKSEAVNA